MVARRRSYFVSDLGSGWWNLYREHNGSVEPMAPMDAEFGRPQWQFGMSTYAFESAAYHGSGDRALTPSSLYATRQ
jgi:hypothetical protein